ncbi:MAG TPA: acetate--CoA ligase family protein [Candidatus Krumholzibacteria bacterium]|nr:acetate--CoA ligase family protein [Candidatus Krumholzibacteria bacterium]
MSASLQETLQSVQQQGRDRLFEGEAYAFLEKIGIETPRHFFLRKGEKPSEAQLQTLQCEEVVLKIVSSQILHKSDVGGVRMVACEMATVVSALDAMYEEVASKAKGAQLSGILAVERVVLPVDLPGSEFILSARRDPAMGAYLMFGLGGLLSEWYGKLAQGRAHMIMSVDGFDKDVEMECLKDSALGAIALAPSRLHKKAPLDADILGEALQRLARIFQEKTEVGQPRLAELELNPVVARDGRLLALDAVASIEATPSAGRLPRPIANIENLLHPRSAVVYGASSKHMNAGRIILDNLKRSEGITYGKLWAIHPKVERIDGVPCVPDAASLPEPVDLAVVSIPAPIAPDAIEELVATEKTRSIILIPGGFAETGQGDLARRIEESLASSRSRPDGGPVMVGGNCLGIVSKREYNTFFLPHYKLPFHKAPGTNLVAVSQSGAYLVSFTSNLDGIIFPRVSISYGNEMDLTASDFLQYYLEHESDTQVFCFYIEGFQPLEGERFLGLVRAATAQGKAVVVYKAGKTAGGAKAAASHTASIAGDYEIARVMLKEAGAIVCETLNQFEDYTKILTMLGRKRANNRRLGVITNAGFEAGAVSDHLYGLKLTEFSQQTRDQLREVLPEIAHVGNPVDATPMAGTKPFIKAVEILAHAEEVDALVVSAIPATPGLDILAPDLSGQHSENIFSMNSLPSEFIRVSKETDKPMVVVIDSGRLYDPSVLLLERAGLPVYRKIDRASRALSVAADYWIGSNC